jgi:transcriptional regulator with XRE-family HTH domain
MGDRITFMEDNIIGKNIVNLRKKNNISQVDFASRIHVSASTLCRWEKGSVVPSLDSIDSICREFNVSKAELIEEEVVPTPIEGIVPHKKKWLYKMVIAVLITTFLMGVYFGFPRYSVVDESDVHDDIYGRTITLSIMPILGSEHKKAEKYAESISRKYLRSEVIEAVEVVVVPRKSETSDNGATNEVFVYIK